MKRFHFLSLFWIIAVMAKSQIVGAGFSNAPESFNRHGFYDANKQWVVKPIYSNTIWDETMKLGLIYMGTDGKPGMVNQTGKVIFPPNMYTFYYITHDGDYIEVGDASKKRGMYSRDGKMVVPCKYKSIFIPKDKKYIQITDDYDTKGLLKIDGSQWLPCLFDEIYVANNYIEVTDKMGLRGARKFDGSEWIPCKYSKIFIPSSNEYIQVTDKTGLVGLLKYDGSPWVDCKYSKIYVSRADYIEVTDLAERKGLLNIDGIELLPCKYSQIIYLKEEKAIIVSADGLCGVFSIDGKKQLIPTEYADISKAAEGIFLVNKGGKKEGYKIIGGKWGYYANGKEIIPCQYDEATAFTNDVANVKKDGETKLIKNPLKNPSQINLAQNATVKKGKKAGPTVSRYPAPDSDVDRNIPVAKTKAENTFAFIIANENYPDAPVPYSLNDGRMFREYCLKTLGLPEKNINMYEDATFGSIITAVEKMKQVANAYDGEAFVIFYYAGHGFPDEKQQSAYLLPIDGNASSITTTGYSLVKLYGEISKLKLKSAVVFLDACFSGAKREDDMLASSRGVAIKVREDAPSGNMVVFSAAQGDETAHQMEEKHHGLFTYYLLKELQTSGGDIELGTLTDNVTKQVKRQSVVINNKKQTPIAIPSAKLVDKWKTMKLK